MIVYPHATDPPKWWCVGHFDDEPIAHVGVGHAMRCHGWPVHRCRDCGAEIFLAPRPHAETVQIARFADAAA